jgi:peptidylprolyl isomerase
MIGAAGLVAAALAGCSLLPGSGGCDAPYKSGEASSLVTAEGSFGVKPTVDFPTPLVVTTPEVTVIDPGDGALIGDGDQVDYSFGTFYGADGQDLSGDNASARIAAGLDDNSISSALVCAHVGDRLAVATTVEQATGAGSGGDIGDDETLVVVVDVIAAYLGKADGFNQLPKDGMPTVVTAVDGTPGITVPLQDPPAQTTSSVIKGGDGRTLKADDMLVSHYSFWTWPATPGGAPEQIESSWTSHTAANLKLAEPLPTGLLDALVGQRVGSQVLVVLTPGDGSFPAGQGPAADDATYIFVFDLLGIQK